MSESDNRSLDRKNYLVLLGASLTPCVLYSISMFIVFFSADYVSMFSMFNLETFTIYYLCISAISVAVFCLFYLGFLGDSSWFMRLSHFLLWTIFSIVMNGFSILFTGALIIVIDGFPVP